MKMNLWKLEFPFVHAKEAETSVTINILIERQKISQDLLAFQSFCDGSADYPTVAAFLE